MPAPQSVVSYTTEKPAARNWCATQSPQARSAPAWLRKKSTDTSVADGGNRGVGISVSAPWANAGRKGSGRAVVRGRLYRR